MTDSRKFVWMAAMIIAGLSLIPDPAAAYIGPGAGLTAIGTVLALVGAIILAIFGFVWYPIKRYMRKRRDPMAMAPTLLAAT